ncbi:MAG: CRTAC1 family protein [Desulfuromonadales bacterium]|nr:CRTAC1 family protein [Desulfuromonadales bacterium]
MGKMTGICLIGCTVAALVAAPALAREFVDVSRAAGVADDGLGKGVAFADVNNDGFVDLYVSNKGGANKLYLNNGDGTFRDATATAGAGLDAPGFTMGSVFGDFDGDGNVDLYLATGGQYEIEANRLFKGNGDGTFVEVTDAAGVGLKAFTYSASFVDYDNDGDLDLYCANYGVGAKNVLFRNNGDGTFTDVTDAAGVGDMSWSWMGVWSDVNNDGLVDLYVINGRYPAGERNRLYINKGDGTFSEEAEARGVADANWGLGASFADIDNDGDQDLFVSNYIGGNSLYLNDGTGNFSIVNDRIAAGEEGWGKGPTFGDIDHDGDLDFYEGDCKLANQLYLNDGQGKFVNVAADQPQLQCATVRTKGTAFADIDNDGDLDLYVINWGAENKLYMNTQNDGNWVKIGGLAFGAKVALYDGEQLLASREIRSASGFCAQEPSIAHFGVSADKVYTAKITAPGGESSTLQVRAGQFVTVK